MPSANRLLPAMSASRSSSVRAGSDPGRHGDRMRCLRGGSRPRPAWRDGPAVAACHGDLALTGGARRSFQAPRTQRSGARCVRCRLPLGAVPVGASRHIEPSRVEVRSSRIVARPWHEAAAIHRELSTTDEKWFWIIFRAGATESHRNRTDLITVHATTTGNEADCPSCGTVSTRVHSSYLRRLDDFAASGRRVVVARCSAAPTSTSCANASSPVADRTADTSRTARLNRTDRPTRPVVRGRSPPNHRAAERSRWCPALCNTVAFDLWLAYQGHPSLITWMSRT